MLDLTEVLALGLAGRARSELAERCYASAHAALEVDDLRGAAGLFALMALARARDVRPWLGLATLLSRLDDTAAALGLLDLAAVLDPESRALCLLGRAQVLARAGQAVDARVALEQAEATGGAEFQALLSSQRGLG
jgi:hypothetical protein